MLAVVCEVDDRHPARTQLTPDLVAVAEDLLNRVESIGHRSRLRRASARSIVGSWRCRLPNVRPGREVGQRGIRATDAAARRRGDPS
jgi:hypothetical protein